LAIVVNKRLVSELLYTKASTKVRANLLFQAETSQDLTTESACSRHVARAPLFGSGAIETSLFNEGEFRGDDIKAYYCRKCGFIELYRKEKKRLPSVTTEKELWDYSDTQE
jgi:hypothetical protein